MSVAEKLAHEVKAVLLTTLYFGTWIGALLVIKSLILAEYHIPFHGFSMALVGALILSKVVLIMEHVPLGKWVGAQPAWVDVILRTLLYSLGVLGVLILEKGIEGRHEHGGFGGAVGAALQGVEAPHLWSNIICVTGALLLWNTKEVVEEHLGNRHFGQLLLLPKPAPTVPGIQSLP